jgi:hypothetical protein
VSAHELHQNALESIRDVNDQPVFVSAKIKDDPIVGDKIDCRAEMPLYILRARPLGRRHHS